MLLPCLHKDPVLPACCGGCTRKEQAEQVRMRWQFSKVSFITKLQQKKLLVNVAFLGKAWLRDLLERQLVCALWCWAVVGQSDGIRSYCREIK